LLGPEESPIMRAITAAPVVQGNPLLGSLLDIRRDRVGFFCGVAREHGDVARAAFPGRRVLIVSGPEPARAVLVDRSASFLKGPGIALFGKALLGNGLLISERELHRRQRRMMAPAFVQKRIAGYADTIVARSRALLEGWGDGDAIDASREMMRLTLEIVGKTLFDAEVGSEAAEIGHALEITMAHVIAGLNAFIPVPLSWPTPANLRNREAVARLDETVYRLIRARRAQGGDKGDFLSMLLLAQDEDDGSVMTDRQVRDEAMNIFLAGHETTANALAWTLYLLAQHPAVRARVEREVDAALGGAEPTLAALARLPYTLHVLKEAMRIYPPAYVTSRIATEPVEIGGQPLDPGDIVVVNIIGMHRRADLFPDPHRFDPDRFAPEAEKSMPRHAYLPFGAGPRVCIGNHFAMMEGHLILAALSQRVRLDLPLGWRRVEPVPLVTLRPGGGVPMRVTRRSPGAPRPTSREAAASA
jgi:cytochrome P450